MSYTSLLTMFLLDDGPHRAETCRRLITSNDIVKNPLEMQLVECFNNWLIYRNYGTYLKKHWQEFSYHKVGYRADTPKHVKFWKQQKIRVKSESQHQKQSNNEAQRKDEWLNKRRNDWCNNVDVSRITRDEIVRTGRDIFPIEALSDHVKDEATRNLEMTGR